MNGQQIVGRQRELARIAELKAAKKPAFVAVYGRRRIGKTFLIRQAFSDQLVLELSGMKDGRLSEQLHNFTLALAKASQGNFPAEEIPKSWQTAFEILKNWCETLPKNKQYVLLES